MGVSLLLGAVRLDWPTRAWPAPGTPGQKRRGKVMPVPLTESLAGDVWRAAWGGFRDISRFFVPVPRPPSPAIRPAPRLELLEERTVPTMVLFPIGGMVTDLGQNLNFTPGWTYIEDGPGAPTPHFSLLQSQPGATINPDTG